MKFKDLKLTEAQLYAIKKLLETIENNKMYGDN